jgi:hypothetical protein
MKAIDGVRRICDDPCYVLSLSFETKLTAIQKNEFSTDRLYDA